MAKRIFFALALTGLLTGTRAVAASSAPGAARSIFQCGQDFQRTLSINDNGSYLLTEGYANSAMEDASASHAYFFVRDMNFSLRKNRCTLEIHGQNISSPTDHVIGKRSVYQFRFHFPKNDPSKLSFDGAGKAAESCRLNPEFINHLKGCHWVREIPEVLVCQSPVVQGVQVKTIFRMDPLSENSERQVYKLTPPPQPAPSGVSSPSPKEENLGLRPTKFKWSKSGKACDLKITEQDESADDMMEFVMHFEGPPTELASGRFNKLRLTLDQTHVADLMDDKKNVQCALSPDFLKQVKRCSNSKSEGETSPRRKKSRKHRT
jgi:hypothetical protein